MKVSEKSWHKKFHKSVAKHHIWLGVAKRAWGNMLWHRVYESMSNVVSEQDHEEIKKLLSDLVTIFRVLLMANGLWMYVSATAGNFNFYIISIFY